MFSATTAASKYIMPSGVDFTTAEHARTCIEGVQRGMLSNNEQHVGRLPADEDAWRVEGLRVHVPVHVPLLALAKGAVDKDGAVQHS